MEYPKGMNTWVRTVVGIAAVVLCSACSTPASETSPPVEAQNTPTHASDDASPTEPNATKDDDGADRHSEASFDPESIHVLVNKHHGLEPEDFEPADLRTLDVPQQFGGQQLREEAATALEKLVAAAADEGVELWVTTAYREFEHQQALYDQSVAEIGQDATDRLIARPGYT